jgi:hypothetical protein
MDLSTGKNIHETREWRGKYRLVRLRDAVLCHAKRTFRAAE